MRANTGTRNPIRFLRAASRGALAAVAGLICIATVIVAVAAIAGYRPIVIQTGSMGEAAPPGSLVVVRPVDDVAIGDVLVMRTEGRATVTHRVVDIEERPDGRFAVTRGDANPDIDPEAYPLGDEELTARWVAPDLGHTLLAVRRPVLGLTLLIGVVTAAAFVLLRRIWRPKSARGLPADPTSPPPPPSLRSATGPSEERRRRSRRLVGASLVGAVAVFGGTALSLYFAVDTVTANDFGTLPCYDARLGSVQKGQHVSSTSGTDTVSITAVDPAKSFLLTTVSSDSNEPADSVVVGRLASSTSIEFIRATDAVTPPDVVVEWTVVEYDCGVTVQRGVTPSGVSPRDVTISSVDPASSFAFVSTTTTANADTFDLGDLHAVSIVDPTTLRIEAGSVNTTTAYWQVVTFDAGDASTQQLTASLGPGSGVASVTVPSTVDPSSTALLVSATTDATDGGRVGDRTFRARLVDGDTVEITRSDTSNTVDVVIQVVEFADGTTVRHGILDLAATEATGTVTIPPVQVSRSSVSSTVMIPSSLSGGSTTHVVDDTIGEASARTRLVDERTVEVARDSTTSAASFAWQVITWNGPNWADLDADYRSRIDVTAGSVVTPTGYTTPLTFDHATLVSEGRSLSDGSDLRVWRHDGLTWTELDRVLDDDSAWNAADTTFWFRTAEPIAVADTVSYWLYFGDTAPDAPLEDPDNVWLVDEGFDDGTLGAFEDRTGNTGWYDDDPWTRRIIVDIDGSGLAATVTGHVVPVRIVDSDLAANAQSDGDDFVFTAADGTTVLPHQIEAWDDATGTLNAWVRVPSVASGSTTSIHLYYGSASAPDQSDPRAVWTDRHAAWLLAADPATDRPALDDEGPGQRDGVALADASAVSTSDGGGIDLDGALDRLESQPFTMAGAPFTVGAWFQADDLSTDAVLVAQGDPTAGGVFDLSTTQVGVPTARVRLAIDGTPVTLTGGTLGTSGWHHVVATWDGSTVTLFVDGAQVGSAPADGLLDRPGATPVVIGADPAGANALDGRIGHVTVADGVWSASQIALDADALATPAATVAPNTSTGGTWFEQGTWSTRWPLVVDSDYVAGPVTDHPLLVRVSDAAVESTAEADGSDLVFTAADGVTRLDHHVETWDPGGDGLTAWVRVPSLDGTTDTTIYVYAGNATAVDQQDVEGVWGPDADLVVTDTS